MIKIEEIETINRIKKRFENSEFKRSDVEIWAAAAKHRVLEQNKGLVIVRTNVSAAMKR